MDGPSCSDYVLSVSGSAFVVSSWSCRFCSSTIRQEPVTLLGQRSPRNLFRDTSGLQLSVLLTDPLETFARALYQLDESIIPLSSLIVCNPPVGGGAGSLHQRLPVSTLAAASPDQPADDLWA